MLQAILVLAISFLIGLICIAVCVWAALTGRLFTLDGLLLVLISLSVGGLFMLNVAWSVRSGEFREVLKYIKKGPPKTEA